MIDQNVHDPAVGRGRRVTGARLAAVIGAGLLLAACGNSASPGAAAGGVATRDNPQLGTVLTNASGHALYFTDQEADGKIRCVEGCLNFWSPMVMANGAAPTQVDGLGVIRREPGGQSQLTYQGKPLYTFSLDKAAGQISGDKVEDDFSGTHFVWHAVVVGGQPSGGTQMPSGTSEGGGNGY